MTLVAPEVDAEPAGVEEADADAPAARGKGAGSRIGMAREESLSGEKEIRENSVDEGL